MTPTPLPSPTSAERSRLLAVDLIRRRALDRLYERRATVESLIRSLEDYERCRHPQRAECIEFSAERRCS